MTENKFTQGAQNALLLSFSVARKLGHSFIGSEHILLGVFQERTGSSRRVLSEVGLTESGLEALVIKRLGQSLSPSATPLSLSVEGCRIIEGSVSQAIISGQSFVSPEHILMSLLLEESSGGVAVLRSTGIEPSALYSRLFDSRAQPQKAQKARPAELKLTSQFGVDLTKKAALGQFDPVTGRDAETMRIMGILCRRQKSNPVLIGDAGVGKTAIAEHLAQKIALGTVPPALQNKRIISLELATLLSGTKYRGEFEERTRQILEEVRTAGDVILFIDEMHMLAGAGAAEGAIDAANILKPALSRGGFQIIGATTASEYKQYIRRDSALERRFQPVDIKEPSREQTLQILKMLRPRYESHHGVRITDEALTAAVDLSARYMPSRRFPDKAIDLLDEASAEVRLKNGMKLTQSAVAEVLAEMTGIKTVVPERDELEQLRHLEQQLSARVVGQERAIAALARAVRRARLLPEKESRPAGAFLFCGMSGVGKTELAKALAAQVFHDEGALIRLDMSEYMEPHSVSKIIGSPPGYIGYGRGGFLTERVRRCPYSLLLLDEVEKAHPDVLNLFLQMLDEGFLTDSEGERCSFRSCMIVMTSNAGMQSIASRISGFSDGGGAGYSLQVKAQVKKAFSPEFLNRLDEVIAFEALGESEISMICEKQLASCADRVLEQKIKLSWDGEAVLAICKSIDKGMGARPLRMEISNKIEDKICDMLMSGALKSGMSASVTAQGSNVLIQIV